MSITAVSTDAQGNPLGGQIGSFSPDGTKVVFNSNAFYFGYQDPNVYQSEVYEKDLATGVVTRVSNSRFGGPADGNNVHAAYSPDGTQIAFTSNSRRIEGAGTEGPYDNGDLLLYANGTTTRVSNSYDGTAVDGASGAPAFSPDGTEVAYLSYASNLVPNDTNQQPDIFLTNLTTGATTRISTDALGGQVSGPGGSMAPLTFTPDGQNVIFASNATNLVANDTNGESDIFEKNILTQSVTRLSTLQDGTDANGQTLDPAISADGTKVAFDSSASNFVSNDTNRFTDVFVKDLGTGAVTRVSTAADGTQGNGNSSMPVFSPDGTKIAFVSDATNLTALHQANAHGNIFVKDLNTGEISQVSVAYDGSEVNGDSSSPSFSPDSTKILFTSSASNLVPNDTDGQADIFEADVPVCFASGTQIRTARGDVAVEALEVGDLAMTASGAARPIRWIGKRSFDCTTHPTPEMVRPIRVTAGAFGSGRPYRDLVLSPHHAVAVTCVDEVLIPIRLLVNGSTIARVDYATEVTYWHVELDSHDILLADGLPAESYIDVGNRSEFEGEATLTLHPHFKSNPRAGYCRPLVTGGTILAAVRAQLAALASAATIEPAAPVSFHLLVDGTPIAPVVDRHSAAFVVPAGASDIRLVSPTWSPHGADPWAGDARRLGILVQSLSIEDLLGAVTEIPLDHPALAAGFHPVERTAFGSWRWTDGDALLSGSLWSHHEGPSVLRLIGQFHHAAATAEVASAA